jgi:hypothetical protein
MTGKKEVKMSLMLKKEIKRLVFTDLMYHGYFSTFFGTVVAVIVW